MSRRRLLSTIATVAVIVIGIPSVALAAWVASGGGNGVSKAVSMPTGNKPTVSQTGRNVTLSWAVNNISGVTPVNGYVINRYDAGSNTVQTIGSACSGTISILTCTEAAVPAGTWYYTVAPKQAGWLGSESPASSNVTIAAPSLTFSSSTVFRTLPTVLSGTIASFITGETVVFRLDNATSGTVLTSSVTSSPIPANGQSAVTVTIPAGTTNGVHTVYAVGSLGTQASAAFTFDNVKPVVATVAIAKTTGYTPGFIHQGGTYTVYANVTDAAPSSGIATVTANVGNITTGSTAVAMTAGSYTVAGASYNYQAALTADAVLAAGSKTFSVTATDAAGNVSAVKNGSVTVDNTAPSATNVQTTNGGGTAGKIEVNDVITYTFSEQMDPGSVLTGWDGTATTVTLRLTDNAAGDYILVYDAANTTLLPLNQLKLGRTDYVNANSTITGTMTLSGSTITITVASVGAGITTAAGTGTMQWVSNAGMYDRAGNACPPATVNESGAADKDF